MGRTQGLFLTLQACSTVFGSRAPPQLSNNLRATGRGRVAAESH